MVPLTSFDSSQIWKKLLSRLVLQMALNISKERELIMSFHLCALEFVGV